VVLVDDLGKYEVSAYGAQHVSTPNIDRIGQEGIIFTEGYVTAPTCAPSRAGIMTGRVQNRYGFETQIMEFYPTNMVEYLSGKWFVHTGEFVMKSKPDLLAGFQLGGGFRIKKRAMFGEIDFAYITQGITYSPRDEHEIDVDEDISIMLRGFQVPILIGWVPVRTPVFGLYLYGGLENRFSMNGRLYFLGEEIKFRPKEVKLHFYNFGARYGTQVDLAMFNFDLSYIIGITNSFRDRTRTNSHIFMFNLGFLF